MKKTFLIVSVLSAFLLVACNEKNYTVSDFMKDEKLYNEFRGKCKNGELHEQDINCVNIKKARKEKENEIILKSVTKDHL